MADRYFPASSTPPGFSLARVKLFLKIGIAERGSRNEVRLGNLVHRGVMMNNRVSVRAPWRIEAGTHLGVVLHDRRLVGSMEHFLRFDFYPHFAPSHPERHLAYWDIPFDLDGARKD